MFTALGLIWMIILSSRLIAHRRTGTAIVLNLVVIALAALVR